MNNNNTYTLSYHHILILINKNVNIYKLCNELIEKNNKKIPQRHI